MHDAPMMDGNEAHAETEALELRVIRALERQPEVAIPADFAARVAGSAGVRRATSLRGASLRRTHYGFGMGLIGMAALLVAMLAFASRAGAGSVTWVGLEWVLCAQFVGLAMWFGLRRGGLQ
jgi:hypothetical protein